MGQCCCETHLSQEGPTARVVTHLLHFDGDSGAGTHMHASVHLPRTPSSDSFAHTEGADLVARPLIAPGELPIGVITAFFGAPFFALVLKTSKGVAT